MNTRADTFKSDRVFRYSLSITSILLNPLGLRIFNLVFFGGLFFTLFLLLSDLKSLPLWFLSIFFALLNWRYVWRDFRSRIRPNLEIDLVITDELVCLQQNCSFFSMPRKTSKVSKGFGRVNLIRNVTGQYFLVDSASVSFEELQRSITIRAEH